MESLPPISGGSPESDDQPAPAPEEPKAEAAEPTPAEPTPAEATLEPEAPAEPEHGVTTSPEVAAEATPAEEVTAVGAPTEAPAESPADASAAEGEAPAKPPTPAREPKGRNRQDNPPRPPKPKGPPPPPRPHPADEQLSQLAYVIVNEAGASVYSVSPVGREEFPDFDDKVRGTISIGRRLQDPLSELVKIEPQNIGVGLYQHDVNPKQLKESLEGVIASCVNFVGVDLNTASIPLLRHVSGLNQLTARRVVERRNTQGPYTSRAQLLEVEGVGPATYTQAAGFLKIGGGDNPLDRTWVHPESYEAADKLLAKLEFTPDIVRDREKLPELHAKLDEADLPALSKELEVGEPTLRDIFDALARPDRDPRDDLPKPIFKKGVLKLEDLVAGMELKGTVLNVVDFGAFVDIGLKDSGLVHISQLANRYIKSPHDVVSVGDVVSAWVMGVDGERKRVSLTMVKPGTERPRGERASGGGGGGGGRRPQGEGAEARGGERRPGPGGPGGRGPRRDQGTPSQLTSPPIGTPAGGQGPGGPGDGPPQRRPEPPRQGGRESNFRPAAGGGMNRGGGRPGGGGGGGGGRSGPPSRFEPRPPATVIPAKPAKPAPPPPPLSKEAITGSVPLRSFGQLKQLFDTRSTEEIAADNAKAAGGRVALDADRAARRGLSRPPRAEPDRSTLARSRTAAPLALGRRGRRAFGSVQEWHEQPGPAAVGMIGVPEFEIQQSLLRMHHGQECGDQQSDQRQPQAAPKDQGPADRPHERAEVARMADMAIEPGGQQAVGFLRGQRPGEPAAEHEHRPDPADAPRDDQGQAEVAGEVAVDRQQVAAIGEGRDRGDRQADDDQRGQLPAVAGVGPDASAQVDPGAQRGQRRQGDHQEGAGPRRVPEEPGEVAPGDRGQAVEEEQGQAGDGQEAGGRTMDLQARSSSRFIEGGHPPRGNRRGNQTGGEYLPK